MKTETISVTEASRNFADCLNRAHYQGTTFVLLKNGKPFARLIPDGEKIRTGRDLAKALREVRLTNEEAEAWRQDIRNGHKILTPPVSEWE